MKTVKEVKKVNTEGVLELADVLVHNYNKYEQEEFGSTSACGTTCCLAGFAYAMKIGVRKFNAIVKRLHNAEYNGNSYNDELTKPCIAAGSALLGVPNNIGSEDYPELPQIFDKTRFWPEDLRIEYDNAETGKQKVIVALKALRRLKADGEIDDNPDTIYTVIPQLDKLLKPVKKVKNAGK